MSNIIDLEKRLNRCKIGDGIMMFFDNDEVIIVENDAILCVTDTIESAVEFLEDAYGIE